MAKQNRTTLKGYFETGDIPTGGNYVDLIDSPLILDTENTGSINILGTITASSNISASGTIVASNFSGTTSGINTGDQDLSTYMLSANTASFAVTSSNVLFGNITASGNISASGTISAFGSSSLVGLPTTEPLVSGGLWLSGSGGGSASGSKYLMVFTG
jgi:hypothetical protein